MKNVNIIQWTANLFLKADFHTYDLEIWFICRYNFSCEEKIVTLFTQHKDNIAL